ncbi:3-deoxy-D-manno-octulosonic acid kinase [Mesocricetibacter intestinalis]|uniref:3-deoxy-D-manno-octulosonic acid kinase n=1 Tax=Mesocricetibacter intestinalis TaxID=1521930 RepID=A0A4R6V6R9_9PAST|nr:3-deoxy-D-manno-octulosonic acid kinase [Mesocricetibacter intestinalis]TDQ56837.1 3-deoxy-D-manno-octulosonic acid kinase [Mesocricetibacter intestinalis]
MLELQQRNTFFLFNFDQPKKDQERFLDPEYWHACERISGSAQGRGTTWFIRSRDIFGCDCALRHYYRGGFWAKFNKDLYLFSGSEGSRSFLEFRLLDQLYRAGVPVPRPIAAALTKNGFGCYRADILVEKIENARDLTALLRRGEISAAGWRKIGALIRQLHDLQICHTDLNAHNILVRQNEKEENFWLIDFDKCARKKGQQWKKDNLQRLRRSFLKEVGRLAIRFQESHWQLLEEGYRG